jgi:hypothetical protein
LPNQQHGAGQTAQFRPFIAQSPLGITGKFGRDTIRNRAFASAVTISPSGQENSAWVSVASSPLEMTPSRAPLRSLATKVVTGNFQPAIDIPQTGDNRVFFSQNEATTGSQRRRYNLRPAFNIRQPTKDATRGVDQVKGSLLQFRRQFVEIRRHKLHGHVSFGGLRLAISLCG